MATKKKTQVMTVKGGDPPTGPISAACTPPGKWKLVNGNWKKSEFDSTSPTH